ncbi:hypothetical protein [Thalassospira lucentensis]
MPESQKPPLKTSSPLMLRRSLWPLGLFGPRAPDLDAFLKYNLK